MRYKLGDLIVNFDSKRKPLSSLQRSKMQGQYPYYGAACIFDYVNDYIFDGIYILLGEDGSVLNPDGTPILQLTNGKFWPNNHTHVLKNNPNLIDFDYLYYLLSNTNFASIVTGAVQAKISQKNLNSLEVDIEDNIENQKKIAVILKSLDNKKEKNNQIIDNLKKQLVAIYEHYLSKNNDEVLPAGWTIKSLYEVTTNIRTKCGKNNFKVLSALNIGKLTFSEEYFTKQVFSKDTKNYIVVEPDDFAYNPARINIGSIGINDTGVVGCVSPVYVVFRAEENYSYFLNMFIKSERFKQEAILRASGSVRQSLNYDDFGIIKIAYPPVDEVIKFNKTYKETYNEINNLLKENVSIENIKRALLPKLLNGEIDIYSIETK